MGLTREIFLRIKEELQTDPQNVGYAGKTIAGKLALLNNQVLKTHIVDDKEPSPLNRILSTLPNLPNTITLAELTAALSTT